MFLARIGVLAIAAFFAFGAAQVASADQVAGTINLQQAGWNANGTLTTTGTTSGSWTLTMDFVNTSGATTDINSFAVQLFSSAGAETFSLSSETINGSSTLGNWEFFANDKLNNGGTPDCSSNSVKGWVCGDTGQGTLHPFSVASGTTTEFVLSGTFSAPGGLISILDLMASGCTVAGTCKLDGGTNNGNKWAVSGTMGAGGSTGAPEPSSLLLLGLGLLGLVLLTGRRSLTA
jgi:hypothetical protein